MYQNELKSCTVLGFPLGSYILGFTLCEWWIDFQSLLRLKKTNAWKVISYVLRKSCVSSESSQETETAWVVKETLMQKIDSVGDERDETPNRGQWGLSKD